MIKTKLFALVCSMLLLGQSFMPTFAMLPIDPSMLSEMEFGSTLSESLQAELDKPLTTREKMNAKRISDHLDGVMEGNRTNEQKLQKAINMNVYLLDIVVENAEELITYMMQIEDVENFEFLVEKKMKDMQYISKLKTISAALEMFNEEHLAVYMELYLGEIEQLVDSENPLSQEEVNSIVTKLSRVINMTDAAVQEYGVNINRILTTHVGLTSAQVFHEFRVLIFFGLDLITNMMDSMSAMIMMSMDAEMMNSPEYAEMQQQQTEMKNMYTYIKNALRDVDSQGARAFATYEAHVQSGGDLETYLSDVLKPKLKPGFVKLLEE